MRSPLQTLAWAVGVVPAIALALSIAGCASTPRVNTEYARPFPPALEQADVLSIQVRRTPTTITFTNTTAADIPACTMWINQRYSRPIDPVPVAASVTYPLAGFVDEFGEGFRPGGFWATRPSQRVVLVQFELPPAEGAPVQADGTPTPRLVGAIVVDGEEDPDARRRRANPF